MTQGQTSQDGVPEVDCLGCRRKVACIRVSDGTVYRPFAWVYTEPKWPTLGWCPQCQAHAKAYGEKACGDSRCAFCAETRRMAGD